MLFSLNFQFHRRDPTDQSHVTNGPYDRPCQGQFDLIIDNFIFRLINTKITVQN